MSCVFRLLFNTLLLTGLGSGAVASAQTAERPNIILVITDDQGWAQLGSHGDDVLRTPRLDALAAESVELTRFYVSPVCAPTRASLMTGRYHYRTGVTDTWLGRAMMASDEVTIAEALGGAGYRTGIFGKWHLGDNQPMRPVDQGFDEAVVHRGGGIGQPSDPPGSDYFDPILFHNGERKQFQGYVTDVIFDRALEFIGDGGQPFFMYIATNAPHSPYLVPDSYRERYAAQGLNDKDARIYGMIENIDDNMGRLVDFLEKEGLTENTILIFMTDNGPTTQRYNAGLRAQKASVYEGGIRAPFFLRWPARLEPKKVETIAAHVDVFPTLLEAAGAQQAEGKIDGRSLMPLLTGEAEDWPHRAIYIQAHRGDEPDLLRNFAAIEQAWKLVQPLSFGDPAPENPQLELYNLIEDPGESRNLAEEQPEIVERMKQGYLEWFRDVAASRGYAPQRIWVGTEAENPVVLTRQDWRVTGDNGWGPGSLGRWMLDVRESGVYEVRLSVEPSDWPRPAELEVGSQRLFAKIPPSRDELLFEGVKLEPGQAALEARIVSGDEVEGPKFVVVRRVRGR